MSELSVATTIFWTIFLTFLVLSSLLELIGLADPHLPSLTLQYPPITLSSPTTKDTKQDFLEATPHWDQSTVPVNTYKNKAPFTGKVVSTKRIVGPKATGEVSVGGRGGREGLLFVLTRRQPTTLLLI